MFSRPVSSGWKPVPTSSSEPTRPRTVTVPSVGSVTRERILSRVLLPAPLRPTMPSTFAFFEIEGNILQRPDKILVGAAVGLPDQRLCQTHRRGDGIHDHIAQHVIAELGLRRADLILLAEVFYTDCCCHLDRVRKGLFHAAEIEQPGDQDQHGDADRDPQRDIGSVA